MATLEEGQSYGLSSRNSASCSKTVIHLKLTDAALKAIDKYIKQNNANKDSPSITFDGNHGNLSINADRPYTFSFSMAGVQGDPNGSFDCIQQTKKRDSVFLEQVGSICNKITIHANDDVYRATKEKMNQVEEDVKKVCAKEIKLRGKYMVPKIKKVLHTPSLPPSTTRPIPPAPTVRPPHPPHPALVSKPMGTVRPVSSDHGRALANIPGNNSASTHSTSGSSVARRIANPSKSSPNSAVINLPYRERVMHLLALRSYKKPELIFRLQQDGVKDKDKSTLTQVLQQVATFCHRDNSYSLAKHIMSDIKSDWPGYSDADRQLLMKKLTTDLRQSTTPSPSASPPNTVPSPQSKSQLNTSQKRQSEEYGNPLEPKKVRISHFDRKKAAAEVKAEPMDAMVSSTEKVSDSSCSPSKKENTESSPQFPDYQLMYQPIKCIEERQRLKNVFTSEFNEYLELHGNVEKIRRKFLDLDEKLRQSKHGSDDYKNWKNQIYREYRAQKSKGYYECKRRYEYLYSKLSHIKKLIVDFDRPTIKAA